MQTQKSGIPLFKLFGFEVSLDWSWFFLAILISWTLAAGYFPFKVPNLAKSTYWIMGISGAALLFVSVILHELSHSLVGKRYGLPISGIKLFIFGGVAEMKDEPPTPKAEFLMAIAGPLCSILLGFIFGLFYKIATIANLPLPVTAVIAYLSLINFALGIFNLLPGFPMDGGRILRSLLWWWKNDIMWATQIAVTGGVGFGFFLIFFGILSLIQGGILVGIWSALLGFFIQFISRMSYQQLLITQFFRGQTIQKYTKTNPVTVPGDITVQNLIDNYFYKYYHKIFPVVDPSDSHKLLGYISFTELKESPSTDWENIRVKDIMHKYPSDIFCNVKLPVVKALQIMQDQQRGRLIVVEHGKLYGIITLKDLMQVIALRMDLGKC